MLMDTHTSIMGILRQALRDHGFTEQSGKFSKIIVHQEKGGEIFINGVRRQLDGPKSITDVDIWLVGPCSCETVGGDRPADLFDILYIQATRDGNMLINIGTSVHYNRYEDDTWDILNDLFSVGI